MTENTEQGDRKLLTIQTAASFAQWLDIFLIFSLPSFVWKADPAQIATLALLFGIPSLLLGPVFGAFLDRNDPRRLMFIGAIVRTLLSVAIAFASSFEVFASVVLAKGISSVLYWPASSVVINMSVAQNNRLSFFSSLSLLDQFSKVATPLIAGALAMMIPMQALFFVSAVATAAAALLILHIKGCFGERDSASRTLGGLLSDLSQGFAALPQLHRDLRIGVAFSLCMSLALAIYDPHLAAFLSSRGFDPTAFSVVIAGTAGGAIFGAALVRLGWKTASPGALIRSGIWCFSSAVLLATMFAVSQMLSVAVLACCWFINGLGYELFAIGSSVNVQNLCPQHLLGRISTSQRSMQLTAVVLGPVLGAWLIREHGRTAPFIFSCAMVALLTFAAVMWRPFRSQPQVAARTS